MTIDFLSLYPARIGRVRHLGLVSFWWSLFYLSLIIRLFVLPYSIALTVLIGLIFINAIVNSFLLKIRRLHDCNFSAWWALLLFVPIFDTLWLIAIFIMSGSLVPNTFGNVPPKPRFSDYLLILTTPIMITFYYLIKSHLI